MSRIVAQITDGLTHAFRPPAGHGLDAAAGAFALVGMLSTLCAVVAWNDDHPDPTTAWVFTAAAGVLVTAALVGFGLMARRTHKRRHSAPVPVPSTDEQVRQLEAAALDVAVAALGWADDQRHEYAVMHAQTDGAITARATLVKALHRAGRINESIRDIAGRLSMSAGPAAVDVFLAVLGTDLVEYRVWETMTRWWRAVEAKPDLPEPNRDGA